MERIRFLDAPMRPSPRNGVARRLTIAVAVLLATANVGSTAADTVNMVALFKDKAMVEVGGRHLMLNVGQSLAGFKLLASDSHAALIEHNGKSQTYSLGARIGNQYADRASGALVQIWPDASSMYRVAGTVNDFPVQFLVDTGATLVAMSEKEAKRIGLPYEISGIAGQTSTAAGIAKTYYYTAKKIRVGAIELRDVEVAVLPGDFPTDVLLGNSFLSRIAMSRNGQLMELRSK